MTKIFRNECINLKPTSWAPEQGAVHESVFRASQILERVRLMLERGDSRETILETIRECEQ